MKNIIIFKPIHIGESIPKINASNIIPNISSITAAPSIVFPTFESNACKSIRDLTVTPTDVATNINPIINKLTLHGCAAVVFNMTERLIYEIRIY